MAKQTLDQWIREALLDTDKDGKCSAMTLVHLVAGNSEREIHSVKFGPKPWEPKHLADLFRGKAENYASELTGIQSFCVLAFYGERNEPQARKPMMIKGDTMHDGLATEPPTKEGQIMQGMRHLEAAMQLALGQTGRLFDASAKTLATVLEHNGRLLAENRDAFEIVKEMMIKQIEGNHTHKMAEMTYQRKTEERSKILGMAPALVNSLMGREIFPQASADTALLDTLMDEVDDNAIQMLATVLKPEVMGALSTRMAKRMKERRAKREQTEALSEGSDPGAES